MKVVCHTSGDIWISQPRNIYMKHNMAIATHCELFGYITLDRRTNINTAKSMSLVINQVYWSLDKCQIRAILCYFHKMLGCSQALTDSYKSLTVRFCTHSLIWFAWVFIIYPCDPIPMQHTVFIHIQTTNTLWTAAHSSSLSLSLEFN